MPRDAMSRLGGRVLVEFEAWGVGFRISTRIYGLWLKGWGSVFGDSTMVEGFGIRVLGFSASSRRRTRTCFGVSSSGLRL